MSMKQRMKVVDEIETRNQPAKAAAWFSISNIIIKGFSFVLLPVYARVMPSNELGVHSIYSIYEQVILILGTFEMFIGTYQRGLFKFKGRERSYTRTTILLMNAITTFLFLFLFAIRRIVYKETGITLLVLVFFFLRTLFQPGYECWVIRRRIEYDYRPVVMVNSLLAGLTAVVCLSMLHWVAPTANVRIISTLGVASILGVGFWGHGIIARDCERGLKNGEEFIIYNLRMALPNIPHALSFLMLAQADRIMIERMVGEKEVAYYSVSYSVASAMMILQASILSAIVPWMYRKMENRELHSVGKVIENIAFFLGMTIIVFTLIIPEVFRMLFATEYTGAIGCIPPITLSAFFMFLYAVFAHYEIFNEKPRYLMYISLICALMNVVLNYYAIPIYGYVACCWTTLVSYIFYALGHCVFAMRIAVKTRTAFPFRIKRLSMMSIIITGVVIMIVGLQKMPTIRYGLLMIIIAVGIVNREYLLKLIRVLKDGENCG